MKAKKRVLFIDRDGVLVQECQVDSLERVHFIPHVMEALNHIRKHTDFLFVMVSNQDGVNTPSFPYDDFLIPHNFILETLRGEDIAFDDINIDYSLPEDNCPGRKPGTAMLKEYTADKYDLENSFMIGDRRTDMILARNLGCKGIWLADSPQLDDEIRDTVALATDSWLKIASFLCNDDIAEHRKAKVERKTKETEISLSVDLDGTGQGRIETGIGFFDHMLEQIVKHASIDVDVLLKGDTWVDEHHSVEDFALAFGKAVLAALGDKRGINRYGFDLLTMDEVYAEVALDFGGRSDLIWNVSFSRDCIGSFPTEMIKHFFKSFSNEARCNLYVSVSEGNSHHQSEAIFKAFARALRQAVKRRPGSREIVSTKGVLE